jgi:hypothetical protein
MVVAKKDHQNPRLKLNSSSLLTNKSLLVVLTSFFVIVQCLVKNGQNFKIAPAAKK